MAASSHSGNAADISGLADPTFPVHEELKAFLAKARQVDDAKKTALEAETKALNLLLGEMCLNMHLLDSTVNDPWYRRNLVLINRVQEIPFGESTIEVADRLTLYEDEQLTRSSVVSVAGHCHSVALNDEKDISIEKAIEYFGFSAICENIIWLIKDRPSSRSQMKEYQGRIERADTLLEAVRKEISTVGTAGGLQ